MMGIFEVLRAFLLELLHQHLFVLFILSVLGRLVQFCHSLFAVGVVVVLDLLLEYNVSEFTLSWPADRHILRLSQHLDMLLQAETGVLDVSLLIEALSACFLAVDRARGDDLVVGRILDDHLISWGGWHVGIQGRRRSLGVKFRRQSCEFIH